MKMYKFRCRDWCVAFLVLVLSVVSCAAPLLRPQDANPQDSQTAPPLPQGKAKSGAIRFVALGDTGTGGAGQLAVAKQLVAFHDRGHTTRRSSLETTSTRMETPLSFPRSSKNLMRNYFDEESDFRRSLEITT
jgi:hypothetical protein